MKNSLVFLNEKPDWVKVVFLHTGTCWSIKLTFMLLSFPLVSQVGKLPWLLNLTSFSDHFIFDPQLPSVSPQRLWLLLPSLASCPDLPCLSLSRSYQMLSDGTTGAPSNKHSDTISLSGKDGRHLPPTLPFYLRVPSTAGMAWGKLGALPMSWILASS